MEYVFEQAKKSDKNEIMCLYKSVLESDFCFWDDNYPNEEIFDFDISRDALFVLRDQERDNKIIAAISIDLDDEVEKLECWSKDLVPVAELSRLVIDMNYQGKSLSRSIMIKAIDVLRERGYKAVHILVHKKNLKAINSYTHLNYKRVGETNLHGNDYWCYEMGLEDI